MQRGSESLVVIHGWWSIPYSGGNYFDELHHVAKEYLSAYHLILWDLVTRSTAYSVWKNRNNNISGRAALPLPIVLSEIQVAMFQWLKARARHRKKLSWVVWIAYNPSKHRQILVKRGMLMILKSMYNLFV